MSKEIKYTEAFEELQQIVADIEDGEISVDRTTNIDYSFEKGWYKISKKGFY
mgnify:CR=1 FL=1